MPDGPLISVRGEAVLEVEPEIAELTVHVMARGSDRRQTLERLTARNQECLDLIKEYGDAVERLETSGLSVVPIIKDRRRDEKVRTYQGTVRLRVVVSDFSVLGELVTRLGDQELTSIGGPWWSLRRTSEVYRQARHQAAREAVTRAREYAEAVGSRLTGLVELADSGLMGDSAPHHEVMRSMAFAGAAPGAAGPPPIDLEPEQQTVRATVDARFTATAPDDLT